MLPEQLADETAVVTAFHGIDKRKPLSEQVGLGAIRGGSSELGIVAERKPGLLRALLPAAARRRRSPSLYLPSLPLPSRGHEPGSRGNPAALPTLSMGSSANPSTMFVMIPPRGRHLDGSDDVARRSASSQMQWRQHWRRQRRPSGGLFVPRLGPHLRRLHCNFDNYRMVVAAVTAKDEPVHRNITRAAPRTRVGAEVSHAAQGNFVERKATGRLLLERLPPEYSERPSRREGIQCQ